ncbi:MAG: S8 family serine peptidase [Nitrospiraceae bacterium]
MGWTICSGQDKVVVWVLDDGVDTVDDSSKGLPGPHPDIRFVHPGMDMDTMGTIDVISTRDPAERPEPTHGTNCAGIIGTITNNLDSSGNSNPLGVAGLAGGGLGPAGCNTGCPIYPLVFFSSPVAGPATDAQVAQAFSFATRVHKGGISPDEPGYIAKPLGSVANLSYATGAAWDPAIIDPKIKEAFDAGIVICASTGNSNKNGVGYPASNLYVTACGASDRTDNRVEKANGFVWGSNYGDKLSVVAPGVEIPTTDAQDWPGQQRGNAGGDYDPAFWGTSAAAAHVSGLAALLLSKYPYLTPTQVRTVIEQTASKVGKFATGSPPQYPSMRTNGTWHEEMGYGLINVSEALSYPADVIIRDTLADTGAEPSSGVFWESPDIVIRPNEADPFSDTDVVLKNQDNYLFVRITNNGPGVARNIVVQARIVPYVGTQFTYPYDWQTNSTFVRPEPLTVTYPTIGQGLANQVVAKFKILRADVDTLWDWSNKMWHPCVLAEVTADNDFRHANNLPLIGPGSSTPQRNNLAQRNLTVLSGLPGAMILYPFIMGSAGSSGAKETELHIDRSQVPEHMSLVLDPHHDGAGLPRAGHTQRIGEIIADGEKIMGPLKVKHTHTIVRMQTSPGARYMLALKGEIPKDARRGDTYALRISQRDFKGNPPMGGATLVINVK